LSAAERWDALEGDKPGRIGPGEAATLATAARRARLIPRGSSREILALLLRLTRGSLGVERSTGWIANELGINYSTAKRSLDALISADLVVVAIPGIGRTRSTYQVDFVRLRALGNSSDSDRSNDHPQKGRYAPSEGALRPLSGGVTPPPSTRARASLPLSFLNPPPPEPATEARTQTSPAASRGDPLPWRSQPETKCAHGRTRAQGGCRLCQTTRRDDAKSVKRQLAEARAQQKIQHLAEQRAAEAQTQAASVAPPADWRQR
jgi:hypothetical protein